jgi:hypothetical protein
MRSFGAHAFSLKRTMDLVQRGHLTIFKNRLIHPAPFDGADFNSSSQNVAKPKRHAEVTPVSFRIPVLLADT